jgi:hypothetical protein
VNPDDQAAVVHAARVFYRLYGDIFRELAARFLPAQHEVVA